MWNTSSGLLDSTALNALLKFLDRGTEPVRGYRNTRDRLVDYFRWKSVANPERCADLTLDRIAKMLVRGERPDGDAPLKFVQAAAVYVLENVAEYEQSSQSLPQLSTHDLDLARREGFSPCLNELSVSEREVLLKFYGTPRPLRGPAMKQLAQERHQDPVDLLDEVNRLRARLEICVRVRGEEGSSRDDS